MRQGRRDPEKLLQRVQEEERQEKRGKLKIYLGAAPGVGKTHTMLHDAIEKRGQGLDVVVGVAESHGRTEINALLNKLEILPRQVVEYRGTKLVEFDLDAALKRHPALILIDEMAHTNAPNLRHNKRWQDIKEILDRGIDVYTTLNVQHIESLIDVVGQIVHARIQESVPDFMIEMAETIELVDLPPEDLLKRLKEGKVYFSEQAQLATEHFFRKGNLIALREIALRVTAERVGAQVLLYRQGEGISHIWPTKEKLLVCVGPGLESPKVIRAARRMATSLQTEWMAVHVDRPQYSDKERNGAIQNLRLAEQLGAQTCTLTGFDIVKGIIDYARMQNVTTIVMWKGLRSRWRGLLMSSLADDLVRRSGEIDVYIVTGDAPRQSGEKISQQRSLIPWGAYALAVGIVGAVTGINLSLLEFLRSGSILLMYLLGVMVVALLGRTGPSILASFLSVAAYDYFFISPDYSFVIPDLQLFFTLIVMLVVTQVISYLMILTRRQTDSARTIERHTASLHALSRKLANSRSKEKLLEIAVQYIGEMFKSEVIIFLITNGVLAVRARFKTAEVISEKEQSVAQWAYELGQSAGRGTDTLPFSEAIYIPLLASEGPMGVLRVRPLQSDRLISPEQMHLLESCANQIALSLEVDRLQEEARVSQLQIETDKVRKVLMQSVSHDLRTPLAVIMKTAHTLMKGNESLTAEKIKKLSREIYSEADQLNRLIHNLLQMTYLEAEAISLQKEGCNLEAFVSKILKEMSKKLRKKPVQLHIPADFPSVPMDAVFMQEVFINLIDNAIKFTPLSSPIEIIAKMEKREIIISIEDAGPGLLPDEVNKLFEKFYRGRMLTTERGLGLGLAICQSIVKAHGGKMWAENRKQGGAAFYFSLPLY